MPPRLSLSLPFVFSALADEWLSRRRFRLVAGFSPKKGRAFLVTGTGRNLRRGVEKYPLDIPVIFAGKIGCAGKEKESHTNDLSMRLPIFFFFPSCLLSPPSHFIPSFSPPLSHLLLPSYTRTPVSRMLDKYLHEFRATARKLEKEQGEGRL